MDKLSRRIPLVVLAPGALLIGAMIFGAAAMFTYDEVTREARQCEGVPCDPGDVDDCADGCECNPDTRMCSVDDDR